MGGDGIIVQELSGDGLSSEMIFSHIEDDHVHFIHEHCEANCLVRIPTPHWRDIGMPRKLMVFMIASETLGDFVDQGFEI